MAEKYYFISYSSKDGDLAQRLCQLLEAQGRRCWIAPRDVDAGAYGASIIRGVRGTAALIFVASENSVASGHVGRELETAVSAGIPIVPVRIDGAIFPEELEYYLAGMHQLDATDRDLGTLVPDLVQRLEGMEGVERDVADVAPVVKPRKRTLPDRFLDALLGLSPTLFALGLSLIGGLFVLLSALLGFAEFSYPLEVDDQTIDKEVGFFWALNWSFSLIVIYPAVAGLGLQALREINAVPARLLARRMVVDEFWKPATSGVVEAEFRRSLRVGATIALIAGAFLIGYGAWEFHTVIASRYIANEPFPDVIALTDAYFERDWSVAALLPSSDGDVPSFWPNFTFSLVAYTYLVGFGTMLVFSVFIFLMMLGVVMQKLSEESTGVRLIPDLRKPAGRRKSDPRCGFEMFENVFIHARNLLLLSFVALFLVNLQNMYLRAPETHILDYALPDLSLEIGLATQFFANGDLRAAVSNLNGALAYGVAGLLFAAVVFGMSMTLRIGARQAHARLLTELEDEDRPLPEGLAPLTRDEAIEHMDAMRFHVGGGLGPVPILIGFLLAITSFVFPKIGVIVTLIALTIVLFSAFGGRARR